MEEGSYKEVLPPFFLFLLTATQHSITKGESLPKGGRGGKRLTMERRETAGRKEVRGEEGEGAMESIMPHKSSL